MRKKSQISVEYALIIALVLVILMAAMYLFRGYTVSSRDQILQNNAEIAARTLIDNAREVYYLGEGSRKTVAVNIPEQVGGISALDAEGGYYLIFNITLSNGLNDVFYESDVFIRKDSVDKDIVPDCYGSGADCEFYHFHDNETSPGLKNFVVEARTEGDVNYVSIELI